MPSPVATFSFCPQSFPASRSFPMSWLFVSGCKSIGASASASVLPMNIQDWFPLRLIGLISLLSKELSRVFSSTIVQKHQFFGALPSLWPYFHIRKWLLERPKIWLCGPLSAKRCLCFLIHCLDLSWLSFQEAMVLISWLQSLFHSDFRAQEEEICHCFHHFPFYLLWSDGTRCHDLSFLNVEF